MSAARGSDKLLALHPGRFTQEHADRLQAIVTKHEAKFVKWWVLGQPAPDVAIAGIQVQGRDRIGSLIEALLGEELLVSVEVFPYGIPYPDIYRIDLRVGAPG